MLFGRMEPRNPSSTDLTDQAWALMAPDVPTAKPGGRLAPYPQRDILEALFAMLRSGCAWRLRPHALPPWPRVYQYCWRGRKAGTWQVRHDLRRCHPGGHGGPCFSGGCSHGHSPGRGAPGSLCPLGRLAAVSTGPSPGPAAPPRVPVPRGKVLVHPADGKAVNGVAAGGTAFVVVWDSISQNRSRPDQGKPLERVGRKATGLRPASAG